MAGIAGGGCELERLLSLGERRELMSMPKGVCAQVLTLESRVPLSFLFLGFSPSLLTVAVAYPHQHLAVMNLCDTMRSKLERQDRQVKRNGSPGTRSIKSRMTKDVRTLSTPELWLSPGQTSAQEPCSSVPKPMGE